MNVMDVGDAGVHGEGEVGLGLEEGPWYIGVWGKECAPGWRHARHGRRRRRRL